MKLSTYAVILSVVCTFFGLGLLVIPNAFLASYGITLDDHGVLMTRGYGLALFQLAIIFFMSRNTPPTDKLWRTLLISALIFNLVNIPLGIIAIKDGVVNSMGWSTIVVYAVFVLGSLYFLNSTKK